MNEEIRVSRAAEFYSIESEFDQELILYRFKTLQKLLVGSSCLELGPGSGVMTKLLSQHFDTLTVVEGSQQLIDELLDLVNMEKVCSLFEEYETDKKFDSIVIEHVIEHVDNPREILARTKKWLSPNGRVYVGVPNANSIHRQAAVHMSLLDKTTDLNQRDLDFGHRRVYDKDSLAIEIKAAGLVPHEFRGVFLKPLSNGQINENWSKDMWDGFYKLGDDYPDLCAEILFVCGD